MRCIFLNRYDKSKIPDRNKYLYETFHLYFYMVDGSKHLEFASIPTETLDYILLYGHNYEVNGYLLKNNIKEKNILLITCSNGLKIPSKLREKNIFISKSNNFFTNLYDGNKYGFSFNITDTEILLYRFRNLELIDQVNKSFERIVMNW